MTAAITDVLARFHAPGRFATRLGARVGDLQLRVRGAGPVRFPISPQLAAKLRAVAKPSPFGLKERTLRDASVRDSWEIEAKRVKIDAQYWEPALAKHLAVIARELGMPVDGQLVAELDKLLIYEQGQFFLPHQDSEKSDDMVGTLVVVLPSDYEGAALRVEHDGKVEVFERLKEQRSELSLIAFYSDCRHEITPLTEGVRVALTYRLRVVAPPGAVVGAHDSGSPALSRALTERVRAHFATPSARRYSYQGGSEFHVPERLVFLLDHEYTERGLAWHRLKNGDRARVGALRDVAERLDCECFLALAEVHEVWGCEHDGYADRRSRRWDWPADDDDEDDDERDEGHDDDDADEHALIDLHVSEIALAHWIDARGAAFGGVASAVDDAELCMTKRSVECKPYQTEHEGYQGNYGNTVDRWYRRAAFVMWPRANGFALRVRADPKWGIEQLLKAARAGSPELDAQVQSLLPRWGSVVSSIAGPRTKLAAQIGRVALRLDDGELARRFVAPLGTVALASATVREHLVALVARHGARWAEALFTHWRKQSQDAEAGWLGHLEALACDLCGAEHEACTSFARSLVATEAAAALDRARWAFKRAPAWCDLDAHASEATRVLHVLAAAVAIDADGVVDDVVRFVVDAQPPLHEAFVMRLALGAIDHSAGLRSALARTELLRFAAKRLGGVAESGSRRADDWAIDYSVGCRCADCGQLDAFLKSRESARDWPLNQDRRAHLHQALDDARLPVSHATLRRGSPFVLQLRKLPELFTIEAKYVTRVEDARLALEKIIAGAEPRRTEAKRSAQGAGNAKPSGTRRR